MRNVMLITGASRGIGAATALLAAERGYAVVLNYLRNREAAEALRQRIERQGGEALAVAADVAEEGDVERLFAAIDERFGRLDALVNNAGVLEAQTRLENIDAARLHRVFATNVTGSFLCAREAVKRLSTRHGGRGGSIVNVSDGLAAGIAQRIHRLCRRQGRHRQHDHRSGQEVAAEVSGSTRCGPD